MGAFMESPRSNAMPRGRDNGETLIMSSNGQWGQESKDAICRGKPTAEARIRLSIPVRVSRSSVVQKRPLTPAKRAHGKARRIG
jgi:hypothetical protein